LGTKLNRNRPNVPKDELEALNALIKLQKECKIIIKPCDKGAGIIVCDFDKYVKSCENDLNSRSSEDLPYYTKITEKTLEEAKHKIDQILKKAHLTGQISNSEKTEMLATDKNPGKFYQTFKVHKKHEKPNLPPGRPIVSGCGSITEKISQFVDYHAKDLVPLIPSYLQDTPDLLRQFETLNEKDLPKGSFPVSIDVVGLYTNIPTEEGIEAMRKTLETRKDKSINTNTIIELLEHVLKLNIFEFNSELYIQNIGTAMGTKAAPTIANIFMAEMDEKI
jgi:hypothetical protein